MKYSKDSSIQRSPLFKLFYGRADINMVCIQLIQKKLGLHPASKIATWINGSPSPDATGNSTDHHMFTVKVLGRREKEGLMF